MCVRILLVALAMTGTAASAQQLSPEQRCETVKVSSGHQLLGRTLREAPDLPPELQRINLMSNVADCFEYSFNKLNEYGSQHPEDYQISFLVARFLWRTNRVSEAISTLDAVLEQNPRFASALVLRGAIYVERRRLDLARSSLESAMSLSPEDLWLNVSWLKLQSDDPSFSPAEQQRAKSKLLELANSKNAPEFVRGSSADFLMERIRWGDPEFESLLRGQLDYRSGHFREDRILELATVMMDQRRYDEARQTLAKIRPPKYLSQAAVDGFYAMTLLEEAADLSPVPSEANARLIKLAKEAVDGDYSSVIMPIAHSNEKYRRFRPFVRDGSKFDLELTNVGGETLLCKAVSTINRLLVEDLVSDGANVNGYCGTKTALGMASQTVPGYEGELRLIIMALLNAGADPKIAVRNEADGKFLGPEDSCRGDAFCLENYAKVIEEYQAIPQ